MALETTLSPGCCKMGKCTTDQNDQPRFSYFHEVKGIFTQSQKLWPAFQLLKHTRELSLEFLVAVAPEAAAIELPAQIILEEGGTTFDSQ